MQIQLTEYQKYLTSSRRYYRTHFSPFLKSKQAKAYTMTILSIFCISFFSMFAIRPTLKTIVELKRQIKDALEVDIALQKKIDSLVAAQEEYQLIKDFVPAISEALPDQPNLTYVLSKIENLASEKEATVAGLQVQSLAFKPASLSESNQTAKTLNKEPTPIDISLTLSGDFKEFALFLEKLFTMRRTVIAESLELAPDESSEEEALGLTLKLKTYYLK